MTSTSQHHRGAGEQCLTLRPREGRGFLYLEARLADESDYDGWEALWTDDAIYWVPAGRADVGPGVGSVGDLR